MPKHLIIGARWNSQHTVCEAIMYAVHPPSDWIWHKTIKQKKQPTWSEWQTCWQNLSNMENMGTPIHQNMRLLQHHGPKHLRQAWGWAASLLAQGYSPREGLEAVFYLPNVWLPLFEKTHMNTDFLKSLAVFCEKKKNRQQSIKKQLRYPLVMSFFIMSLGLITTLDIIPQAHHALPTNFPAWLPYTLWGIPLLLGIALWRHLSKIHTPFFRFLELALKAGHTEHEAIHHFCHTHTKSELNTAHQRLQQGYSFNEALKGIWPNTIVDLIALNTDKLSTIIGAIADMVEADQQEQADRLISIAQTGLVLMMGIMVLWMAWTTLIPMYESLDQLSF